LGSADLTDCVPALKSSTFVNWKTIIALGVTFKPLQSFAT
jgi:hypothetical protein